MRPFQQIIIPSVLVVVMSLILFFLNIRYQLFLNSPVTLVLPILSGMIGTFVSARLNSKSVGTFFEAVSFGRYDFLSKIDNYWLHRLDEKGLCIGSNSTVRVTIPIWTDENPRR